MKYIYQYNQKYIHISIIISVCIIILFSPMQLFLYSISHSLSAASILGSALLPIWFFITIYPNFVGFAKSALIIDDFGITQAESVITTIEWDEILEVKIKKHSLIYFGSYVSVYGRKMNSNDRRKVVRISCHRENYKHAWITIFRFATKNRNKVIFTELFTNEINKLESETNE